jgi:hypothetical protein
MIGSASRSVMAIEQRPWPPRSWTCPHRAPPFGDLMCRQGGTVGRDARLPECSRHVPWEGSRRLHPVDDLQPERREESRDLR